MTPEEKAAKEKEIRARCVEDFEYYARLNLKIRPKSSKKGLVPLVLNKAQKYVLERLLKQWIETGRIRAISLKGRQQGISTLIEAFFYWLTTHNKGKRAYILTHEASATANLFEMAKRYHDNSNLLLKPSTSKDSNNELHFDGLDSGYKVGTAGNKNTGRSGTVQYFHGSEVAFWPNAKEIAAGVMESIPDEGSIIIMESTSDGKGNFYYEMCRQAINGKSEFELIFVPWFWQEEYTREGDIDLSDDDIKYREYVFDKWRTKLTDGQLKWRRDKIDSKYSGDDAKFNREYPATIAKAFEQSSAKQFIPAEKVAKAATPKDLEPYGPCILGVDPARFGDDRTVFYHRQGRYAKRLKSIHGYDQMEVAGLVKQLLDSWDYDAVFIDSGHGIGAIDRLHEMGYMQVEEVAFGGGALNKDRYVNKRNEMYGELLEWLDGTTWIDDESEETELDLCSINYKYDSSGRKVMEPKEETKKRLEASPDAGDALALTFARPVYKEYTDEYDEFQRGYGSQSNRDDRTGY